MSPSAPVDPQPARSVVTQDAVCFTAGSNGLTFGAGVVHAYLAADRTAPAVAAGISGGSLNAAAMQRCYQEIMQASTPEEREIARWRWFRRYLDLLTKDPLNMIWDGLPDQSDFYADMPPVKDPTPPVFENRQARAEFERLELEARKELYLLVKMGNWLACLPLSIGRIANLLVAYVRAREKYPHKVGQKIVLLWHALIVFLALVLYTAWAPWFPESRFNRKGWHRFELRRPLFGWVIWSAAMLVFALLLWGAIKAAHRLYLYQSLAAFLRWMGRSALWMWDRFTRPKVFVLDVYSIVWNFGHVARRVARWLYGVAGRHYEAILIVIGLAALAYLARNVFSRWLAADPDRIYRWSALKQALHRWSTWLGTSFQRLLRIRGKGKESWWLSRYITKKIFESVRLESHLVHEFHIRMRLTRLFGEGGVSPSLSHVPTAVVLVAAPLQQLDEGVHDQLWATEGTPLVDALYASLAVPGLLSPLTVSGAEAEHWVCVEALRPERVRAGIKLDLVNGAVIRKNPLPALFTFLRRHPGIGDALSSTSQNPRVHVVYSNPVSGRSELNNAAPRDIVDMGILSLRLQQRRDTELEVKQTNFTSQLEDEIRDRTSDRSPGLRNIYADDISPQTDITYANPWKPGSDELLSTIAHGCRRTMETLYQEEIRQIAGSENCVSCADLRGNLARARGLAAPVTGLEEVCRCCAEPLMVQASVEDRCAPSPELPAKFPMLTGEESRIVFIASGGVFRGAFHAGMLACMLAAQVRPQMIVGASVGTLMGGALGALLTAQTYREGLVRLGNVIDVFLHVDERVAFTKSFKSAAREIGIRGRAIRLSPRDIRSMIRKGSRSDPSFAAVGAPAPLIDAISDLAMIPHRQTAAIAAKFVSGNVTEALNRLLTQLQKKTLERLGIQNSIIGVSLLEPTVRRLLGEGRDVNLKTQQPFPNIAFFGTTADIGSETCITLGRHDVQPPGSYDFVQAALASSAFPCVFAPRLESEVFPGAGSAARRLADGGMFDNLPFLPAIETLGRIQAEYRRQLGLNTIEFLRRRHSAPDLFIVGSLDIRAEDDDNRLGPFNNLIAIAKRAALLQHNVKIQSFTDASARTHDQLERLLDPKNQYRVPSDAAFVDAIVDAAVMPVFPSDSDHLNPTFAFCRSTGFEPRRVRHSIGDGCFQTFAKLIETPADSAVLKRARTALAGRRIPEIRWMPLGQTNARGECPYFQHAADALQSQDAGRLVTRAVPQRFSCPFYAAWQTLRDSTADFDADAAVSALAIHQECIADTAHRKQFAKERKPTLYRADTLLRSVDAERTHAGSPVA